MKNFLFSCGITVLPDIRKCSYEYYIELIQKYSLYNIYTIYDPEIQQHDADIGQETFSGLDLYSIALLIQLFESMTFLSASFAQHHYQLWKFVGITPIRSSLNV